MPYEVDLTLATTLGYNLTYKKAIQKNMYVPSTSNHGFARFEGKVETEDVPVPNATVCVFNQQTKALIWTYISDSDGKYNILNLSPSVKYFIVAFDKNEKYNAVVHSSLMAGIDPYTYKRKSSESSEEPDILANNIKGGLVENIIIEGIRYTVHTFNSSEVLQVFSAPLPISILVVGGGGGGGVYGGGGGGGGGVANASGLTNLPLGSYNIIVGEGAAECTGNGNGFNGMDSSITYPNGSQLALATGGKGGGYGSGGLNGGDSGSGYINGNLVRQSVIGIGSQTSGTLNGGAGSGGQATTSGGGVGINLPEFNLIPFYYGAGGGSGPRYSGNNGYVRGISGGGIGRTAEGGDPSTAGLPNSGGGGGGSWGGYYGTNGGGSGVVKIVYKSGS